VAEPRIGGEMKDPARPPMTCFIASAVIVASAAANRRAALARLALA
jgi:hypothetical protein